jgi:hypothetical protein
VLKHGSSLRNATNLGSIGMDRAQQPTLAAVTLAG